MVQAHNFLASWQLFPEKCDFQFGLVPISGNYKIESTGNGTILKISHNWMSITQQAYYSQFEIVPDGSRQPFADLQIADTIQARIVDSATLIASFHKNDIQVLEVVHQILGNGYLKITQKGQLTDGGTFENKEIYHKQLSVLPYASSAAGAAIVPTKEGVIKHKALAAMEEQTDMQLNQIKQQIELLAKQAQEIQKRKELSRIIYEASLKFKPQIGQVYHLYELKDGLHTLSLIAPSEWGGGGRFQQFLASVKLLADHTWVEV